MRHYYQYFCSVSRNTSMCSVCGGCLFTEFHLFLSSESLLTVASQNQLETMHCLTTVTLTIIVIHTLPSFHPLIFISSTNFSLSSSTYVNILHLSTSTYAVLAYSLLSTHTMPSSSLIQPPTLRYFCDTIHYRETSVTFSLL